MMCLTFKKEKMWQLYQQLGSFKKVAKKFGGVPILFQDMFGNMKRLLERQVTF